MVGSQPRNKSLIPSSISNQTRAPSSQIGWTPGKLDYEERGVQSPVTVGLLGEISPHKGHDDALEAFRHLGPHYQLLIGGRGKLSYIKSLERRAVGLPIKFLGFVKPADFLKKVDMLIVPSWEEPFGIVILEAMAAGVNVIATAAGGPPEILENGKSGLLVSPRQPLRTCVCNPSSVC